MSAQPHNIVDQGDVNDWKNRFNSALADHTIVTAPTSESARPWRTGFFDCFAPIDLCAITCCVPCITFGKTYHRTRKSPELHEYNCVNTSCLMFTGFSCFGLHWIPIWIQRADVRKKYGLRGDLVTDLLTSCCCGCCSLIQQDKEVECQEELLKQKADVGGYQKTGAMSYQQ